MACSQIREQAFVFCATFRGNLIMQRNHLGILVLSAAAFLAGCKPAEVQPPPASIPVIPPGRSAAAANAATGDGAAAPIGRFPAAPK